MRVDPGPCVALKPVSWWDECGHRQHGMVCVDSSICRLKRGHYGPHQDTDTGSVWRNPEGFPWRARVAQAAEMFRWLSDEIGQVIGAAFKNNAFDGSSK